MLIDIFCVFVLQFSYLSMFVFCLNTFCTFECYFSWS